MNRKAMRIGEYYTIKGRSGSYKYIGEQTKKMNNGYSTYYTEVLKFEDSSGTEYEKTTSHGVSPSQAPLIVPVAVDATQDVTHLPKNDQYDTIEGHAAILVGFLTMLGIQSGILETIIDTERVPTVFIYPVSFVKTKSVIANVYKNNMEIE